MSNPPLNTIYGTTEPKQDGKLTRLVDVAGVEHLAYPTARRTLCLERFADQCSPTRPATSSCPTCTHVRNQMKRARANDPAFRNGKLYSIVLPPSANHHK